MTDWRRRLYDAYISSGQAARALSGKSKLRASDYPYYRKIIKRYLPRDTGISILDLACGYGALLFCLKDLGYRNVKGVDISPEQIELAHRLGIEEAECVSMYDYIEGKREAVDVVFLIDILEHLTRQELFRLLDHVYLALRENGRVIIHVPNGEGIFGMRVRYGDLTHEGCFTRRSMEQALTTCGFKNVRCMEDRPIVNGLKGLIRYAVWRILTLAPRLLLSAETGARSHLLSQNMLVVGAKSAG
jgi:2-polyprenyl-3-methyl-5-hydroxy-6-metoxy-1,4-benzoquinol methylase